MKKQNQIVQAMKCCLTNGKFALLLFINIFLFSSCNQSGSQNSESVSDQVSNLISSSPCDKFIGKYSRTTTVSGYSGSSNIEINKVDDYYTIKIRIEVDNPNLDDKTRKMINSMANASMPDYLKCTCNEKNNLIPADINQKYEYTLDNNNDLYGSGYVFKRVKEFKSESNNSNTETVTEEATDININKPIEIFTEKDVEAMQSTNQKLVADGFVGQWEQETASEQVTSIRIKYLGAGKFQIIIKELNKPSQPSELDITEGTYNGLLNSDNKIKILGFNYTIEKSTHSTESSKYKYISLFISRKPTKNNIAEGAYMEYYQKK